jgi:hypothetical protein
MLQATRFPLKQNAEHGGSESGKIGQDYVIHEAEI